MKKSVTTPRVLLAVLFACLLTVCGDNPQDASKTLPEAEMITEVVLPPFTDAVYYRIITSEDGQAILEELLANDIEIRQAWVPVEPTPCDCITCVTAIVLELRAPDARILDFEFFSDTEPWVINCGVNAFEYYDLVG